MEEASFLTSLDDGIYIGTCGWSYVEWQGLLYSSTKNLLEQYLTYFDVTELNTTFYGTLRFSTIEKFKRTIGKNQFFTAKLPHQITHIHKLNMNTDARIVLFDFLEKMKPLQPELKVILIQLPPWDIEKLGTLEDLLAILDKDYRYAVEFRHHSWLTNRIYSLLEDYQVAYVIVDEPILPIDLRISTDFTYIRWHGHGSNPWYNWRYSDQDLEEWKLRLEMIHDRVSSVLGFFNNHFFGYGPTNALQMMDKLGISTNQRKEKMEILLSLLDVEQTSLDEF
jgi:uncharacterized protein YecE (DUF72 family)